MSLALLPHAGGNIRSDSLGHDRELFLRSVRGIRCKTKARRERSKGTREDPLDNDRIRHGIRRTLQEKSGSRSDNQHIPSRKPAAILVHSPLFKL
jgi:hypothetical protein